MILMDIHLLGMSGLEALHIFRQDQPTRQIPVIAVSANAMPLDVVKEHNNGVPGDFKNAIDWLSRPTTGFTDVFKGQPVAVIGASPGGFGIIRPQNHWLPVLPVLPVLRALGMRYWSGGRLMVSRASKVFTDDGTLLDSAVRGQIEE
jgi:NAD(P)H-dependent FMN reductase